MNQLNLKEVTQYVESNIGHFHNSRLEKLTKLTLKEILTKKNPYLFKAKNVTKVSEIIEGTLNATLSSSEEGMFGNWLERLAIFINDSVYGGRKAAIDGIDLDFDKEGQRFLVAIKSGPQWGNDSQVKKLVDQFNSARKRLATSGSVLNIVCINGCCYGRSREKTEYKSKGNYYKICGKRFWELISGESELYTELIQPIGYQAEKNDQAFKEIYGNIFNKLSKEFLDNFCEENGSIDWDKLLRYNSSTVK